MRGDREAASEVGGAPSERDPACCYGARMVDDAVLSALRIFAAERNWAQFHTPANLAKSISIEAAELLEHYQWSEDAELSEVRDELADVLTYCYQLAMRLELDPDQIVLDKLEKTRLKYPPDPSPRAVP